MSTAPSARRAFRFPAAAKHVVLAAAAASSLACACAPVTAYNGFQARDDKPVDMKVGVDTKSTVLTRLGSPSTVSAFDASDWYYISQVTDRYAFYKPKVRSREVVHITFGPDEKVLSVGKLDLKSGFQIAYDKRETSTRGRQLSWVEQVIGTIGRGGLLPQDNDPGAARTGR